MKPVQLLLVMMATILTSCEFKCSVGGDKGSGTTTKTVTSDDGGGLTGAVIKNDIELEATDVKVNRVFLADELQKPLDSNVVNLNEKITCYINTDTGWTKINGKSFIGASERVTGSDGTVLLDAKDLFEAYDATGVSEEDAKFVSIRARVSEKIPGIDNYTVQFRVWDKKGKGVITGKYKFRVR
ncbi:MAG: hypothetical protein V4722_24875 [Bacteroidota bacterium]